MKLITMKNEAIVSVINENSTLTEMRSLNEAIQILNIACTATCRDALVIFSKVNNAKKYLNKQLETYLSE